MSSFSPDDYHVPEDLLIERAEKRPLTVTDVLEQVHPHLHVNREDIIR